MSDQPNLLTPLPGEVERRALLEAIIYVAEEPLTAEQIAAGLEQPLEVVQDDLDALVEKSAQPSRGVEVRAVAGGYKMSTKPQHHEAVRGFVKTLRPKLKLSLPALETLAVIAYKQPVTLPEIQAVRGVNANAVIHTLLNHKLVTTAGRKHVIGKPMLYKTTKEFLVQFGLNDLSELPNLKELEELSRAALGEGEEQTTDAEIAAETETSDAADETADDSSAEDELAGAHRNGEADANTEIEEAEDAAVKSAAGGAPGDSSA